MQSQFSLANSSLAHHGQQPATRITNGSQNPIDRLPATDERMGACGNVAGNGRNDRRRTFGGDAGGHRGEVPECLLPPPGERKRQFADRDEWRVDDYVARLHAMQRPHARLVARLADEYGIAPRLALAIARAESDFDPAAVSDRNAVGLMQLMADTAERFGVADIHDPEQNVRGGLAYLRWLLAYYRGRVALAVAAYNAGEGAVDRYRGVPPYPETRRYVDKVGARYPFAHHPFDEAGSLGRSPVSVVEPALAAAGDPR